MYWWGGVLYGSVVHCLVELSIEWLGGVLYLYCSKLFCNVIDEHAPLKSRRIKPNQIPYINGDLRRAINVKAMLKRRCDKHPSMANWELYRHQRNRVTKLRKSSINSYFSERCTSGNNFWNSIRPFISDKRGPGYTCVTLYENDSVVNNLAQVCDIFNDYFINMTQDIGGHDIHGTADDETVEGISARFEDHDSIRVIRDNLPPALGNFSFSKMSEEDIEKRLMTLKIRKSTGNDGIQPKFLKLGAPVMASHITCLINKTINSYVFPDSFKEAEVSPIYKNKDLLDKANYRPVSILPTISKLYERVLSDQLSDFLSNIMSKHLAAFRKGYSCQTVLMILVEDWKVSLDNNRIIATMLMDLSRAFDTLPHTLLLATLRSYGLDSAACALLLNYLKNRRQRVKCGMSRSEWVKILKGVPQGSILGPLLFNTFVNDLLLHMSTLENTKLYNYADDNTISCNGNSLTAVKENIETATEVALQWLHDNGLQANPSNFQSMLLGNISKESRDSCVCRAGNNDIVPSSTVKLPGITVDNILSFNVHISNICKSAAKQLNVLFRMRHVLSEENKMKILNAFVLSNFNYCPMVWHNCGNTNTKKMEKLQERGLRFVYNDFISTYQVLLTKSGKSLLYITRLRPIAAEVYKLTNNIGPTMMNDVYTRKYMKINLRDNNRLVQPNVRTYRFGLNSLRYEGAKIWNNLPAYIKSAIYFSNFKNLISKWNGPSCTCGYCI